MSVTRLRDGSRIIGTMARMVRNPALALIAKDAGLDFIMYDLLAKWEANGMQMVMNNLDINILKSGFSSIVEKYST